MKKFVFFAFAAVLLMSCGGPGVQPMDNITLGQAFGHVAQSGVYWLFVIAAALALIVACVLISRGPGWTGQTFLVAFALLAVLLLAIFLRPCDVAANTTVEQAMRDKWLGY